MVPAFAPVFAGVALLVLAGLGKVRRPAATVGALESVGVPARRRAVRALGVAEVVLGVSAVVPGGALPSAFVGLAYLGFSGFIVLALRAGGALSSCGCFGRPDTPATPAHAVVTTLIGASALLAAAFGGIGPGDFAWTAADMALIGFAALVTWLAWLVFAVLPHARLPRLESH